MHWNAADGSQKLHAIPHTHTPLNPTGQGGKELDHVIAHVGAIVLATISCPRAGSSACSNREKKKKKGRV